MKLILFLLLAVSLSAQVAITIDAGTSADAKYFTGGYAYTFPAGTGTHRTMWAGASFAVDVPVPNGSCSVTLDLIEPRPAVATATSPASGPGLRVFQVTTAATVTGIDIFALAGGAQRPYMLTLPPIPVTDGHLRLQFAASHGNAIVSGLVVACTPPPAPIYDPASKSWTFDGDVRVKGNVLIDGYEETGVVGNKPTELRVKRTDGKICTITFAAPDRLLWSCP